MAQRWLYLSANDTAILIDATPGGDALPRIVHLGADLGDDVDFEALSSSAPAPLWGARLDVPCPPCIVPGLESGYFGQPACAPTHAEGWQYDGATLSKTGFTLRLSMQGRGGASIAIDYEIFPHGVLGVRTRANGFPDGLDAIAAASLVLPSWAHEAMTFGGDWAREFSASRRTVGSETLVIESRRGRPGHDRFPGFFIGRPAFGDDHGAVIGVTLAWSGSHRMTIERLREGDVVVQAGELWPDGDVAIEPYESPWVYVTYSARGLNGAMQNLHAFVRDRILPRNVSSGPRLVHLNTWEAVYFKHDQPELIALAERAAAVGAERFVLDDGWFKGRHHDRAGLGDWIADEEKYPTGLGSLISGVRALGLEFGLWVEPEMVNPDSDLARAHPEWLRREANGSLILQRNQAVLDLSERDAADHIFEQLNALLSEHPIAYFKWDMNRDLTGVSREAVPDHGNQVRAVYALIDRLRAAHPDVEIETCASGGGRCDYGMLGRAERVWVSDSNDALDRFDIQRNANLFLPPEIAGVHVGPAACHITGRRLSLDLRAHVAMFGHMGLELDLRAMSDAESQRLAQHIANYKRFRGLIHSGRYWRIALNDPDHAAIGVSAADESEALVLLIRKSSAALGRGTTLTPRGLAQDADYRVAAVAPVSPSAEQSLSLAVKSGDLVLGGRALTARGLDLFLPRPESSLLLHFNAV